MVRAPLMAVKVPTNLPRPDVGKISPYLERKMSESTMHKMQNLH